MYVHTAHANSIHVRTYYTFNIITINYDHAGIVIMQARTKYQKGGKANHNLAA